LKIGSLESEKIIIGSLESEKIITRSPESEKIIIGSLQVHTRYLKFSLKKLPDLHTSAKNSGEARVSIKNRNRITFHSIRNTPCYFCGKWWNNRSMVSGNFDVFFSLV